MRILCQLNDIADGGTSGFGPLPGGFTGLFAVRRGDIVRVYVNACPHLGLPLDAPPGNFLTTDGSRLVCSMHGARFVPETGKCEWGPCKGDHLEAVPVTLANGMICVPADAGL